MGGGSSAPKKKQDEEQTFQRMTVARPSPKQKSDASIKGVGGSTKAPTRDDHSKPSHTTYTQIINEKSSRLRIDKGKCQKALHIIGENVSYDLQWCYASQRGYYPDALEKANQDSFSLCENFNKNSNSHMFGVFDGHGEYGDLCSHYSANNLPALLESEIFEAAPTVEHRRETKVIQRLLTASFLKTNSNLRRSKIDDSLSGTTGIAVFVVGDSIHVANVGDSRAIIGTEVNSKIVFAPLSMDQTPLRKDERERLKKKGAFIRTLDQIEGIEPIHENWGEDSDAIEETSDPPRVWDHSLERPGCAFSRSIGDGFAEMVGVHAEPEIITWKLTHRDKFIIICSDGVTEFLTSSMIVEMMAKNEDHLEGACRIIEEAYRLWLTYDNRTDDITMVVLSLSNITSLGGKAANVEHEQDSPGKLSRVNSISSDEGFKPVRRVMSKSKRKEISENWNQNDGNIDEFDLSKHRTEKTVEELERIRNMVRTNFMFQSLSSSQRDQIFSVMKLKDVKEGELIIREGDKGDEMYVIDAGEFAVFKKNSEGVNQEVFVYKSNGAIFGELSLMYGKPRAASIKAKTEGRLWSIGRLAFRKVLMPKNSGGSHLRLLKSIHFFQDLKYSQIQYICESSYEEEFNSQQVVLASKDFSSCKWAIAIVISGSILLKPNVSGGRAQSRIKDSYISFEEVSHNFGDIVAAEKTKICFFKKDAIVETIGEEDYNALCKAMILEPSKSGGRIVQRSMSIFGGVSAPTPSHLKRSDFVIESVMLLIGDYAFVGSFSTSLHGIKSGKVVAKERATTNRMVERFHQEKKLLESIPKNIYGSLFTSLSDFYQDSKVAISLYSDLFVSDLTEALNNGVITDENRSFYASCVVAAVGSVHDVGFLHRFVNPGSFYISNSGQLKLVDMRYAKAMDGAKRFTICGDPIYFSPELVSQQGYDYGNDIWAVGVTLLEIYGIPLPWKVEDEAKLFSGISSFTVDKLQFTDAMEKSAKDLISGLLNPSRTARLGFKSYNEIKDSPLFFNTLWSSIGADRNIQKIDFKLSVDTSLIFLDSELNPVSRESDIYMNSL